MFKQIFHIVLFMFCAVAPAFAFQGLEIVDLLAPADAPSPIAENWELILSVSVAVLELVIRLLPSNKDYSILSRALKVLNVIVPNRAKLPTGETGYFNPISQKRG